MPREARFFDSCLRADRSVEFPRQGPRTLQVEVPPAASEAPFCSHRRVRALSPVTTRESKLAAVAAKVQEAGLVGSHGSDIPDISAQDMVKDGSALCPSDIV